MQKSAFNFIKLSHPYVPGTGIRQIVQDRVEITVATHQIIADISCLSASPMPFFFLMQRPGYLMDYSHLTKRL